MSKRRSKYRLTLIALSFLSFSSNLTWAATTEAELRQEQATHLFKSDMRAAVKAAPADLTDLAKAMDIPVSQIVSVSLGTSDQEGVSIFTAPLGDFFPINGESFVIMSTGMASSASLPNNEGNLSSTLDGLNNSQGNDMVQMEFNLQAPTGSTCLRFEFSFLSEEFPEYVGSSYNDVFTAEYPNSDLTIVGNSVVAPLNFAYDTEDNMLSVNTVFGVFDSTGTTYDGSTPLLTATTPIDSTQPVRVIFTIQDMGDSIYDSAVFLDNFRWSFEQDCSEGSQISSVIFTTTSVDVAETAGTVTLTVSRIGGSDGELAVNYATTDGTATDGSDYVGATGTLTWADGDSSDKSLTVTITDDSQSENNEIFTVTLSDPVSEESLDSATVTIIDNDNGQQGTLQFTSSTVNVAETASTVTVTVRRVGGSSGELAVNYATTDGTATDGSDYVGATGTLTWADG
ncbi:MAG: Calx-beta domain-containing protein, partial [Pseudomonadota bacterium]